MDGSTTWSSWDPLSPPVWVDTAAAIDRRQVEASGELVTVFLAEARRATARIGYQYRVRNSIERWIRVRFADQADHRLRRQDFP